MAKSAATLASELLAGDAGGLEELRIHEFTDDEEAHDDEATEKLYADFSAEFDRVQVALTKQYGKPSRTGKEGIEYDQDDEAIPLNGIFRFAVWTVGDKQLFAAAAHEDRGVPILLMLGTAASAEAEPIYSLGCQASVPSTAADSLSSGNRRGVDDPS
jgi:hypothetical protein